MSLKKENKYLEGSLMVCLLSKITEEFQWGHVTTRTVGSWWDLQFLWGLPCRAATKFHQKATGYFHNIYTTLGPKDVAWQNAGYYSSWGPQLLFFFNECPED